MILHSTDNYPGGFPPDQKHLEVIGFVDGEGAYSHNMEFTRQETPLLRDRKNKLVIYFGNKLIINRSSFEVRQNVPICIFTEDEICEDRDGTKWNYTYVPSRWGIKMISNPYPFIPGGVLIVATKNYFSSLVGININPTPTLDETAQLFIWYMTQENADKLWYEWWGKIINHCKLILNTDPRQAYKISHLVPFVPQCAIEKYSIRIAAHRLLKDGGKANRILTIAKSAIKNADAKTLIEEAIDALLKNNKPTPSL